MYPDQNSRMSLTLRASVKEVLFLSLPIILGQLGQMLIVAGDVYVATRYSTHAVATIGVANGFLNPLFLFGIGMTMGVSPSFAYLRGKGQDIKDQGGSIFVYSLILGILITLVVLGLNQFIPFSGVESSMVPDIQEYIRIVSWSLPFALVFGGLKEFLQSFEDVIIPNAISLGAVFVNIVVNFVLVFGWGDYAGMGQVGLAYASLSVRIALCFVMIFYTFRKFKFGKVDFEAIKVLVRFSLPIAFMFFLEVLAFCTVTILSGRISVVAAATNNIIMTIASVSFMIPLSLSSAAAVKVGHALGAKDIDGIIQYIKGIVVLIFLFCMVSVFIFGFLPEGLMRLVTQDPEVFELGVALLFIVALFQVFDAFQVTMSGILRGLGETRFPSMMVFLGYWVIGLPLGIYLTFYAGEGAAGLWIGLAVALSIVAISLGLYTNKKIKTLG